MTDAAPAVHGAGLSLAPPPPFVRFERKHAADFMVWIAAPAERDRDGLDLALNESAILAPEDRPRRYAMSAARVLVTFFGCDLTPVEDALLTRYEAHETGVDFWVEVEAAGLVYTAPTEEYPPLSERTQAIARQVGNVAMENTIARSPLVLANDVHLGRASGAKAHPLEVFLVAYWGDLFIKQRTADGWIVATFGATADVLGVERGGWQYDHIRDLVRYMHGTVVPRDWVTGKGEERLHTFSVIQDSDVPKRGEGDGTYRVRLGDTYRLRLLLGRFTPLEVERVARARRAFPRNLVAQRMLFFLDTQRLPWPPGWPIFRVPEGQVAGPDDGGYPLAELFDLSATRHRNVVATIREAAQAVMDEFPEYVVTVKPDKVPTMYRMFGVRSALLEAPADPVENCADPVYEGVTAADIPCTQDVTAPCTQDVTAPCTQDVTAAGTNRAWEDLKSKEELRARKSKEQAAAPSSPSDSSPSQPDRAEQSEYLEGDTIGPELARFDDFWTAYPRREPSHRRDAEKQFAKLSDADQDATIRAAGHVAATKPDPRYVSQPENFIRKGRFKDWQDGPPAGHQSRNMSAADIFAMADAFGLVQCYVCWASLTADEQDDEKLTTHDDGLGWRHIGCDYDRAFLTD